LRVGERWQRANDVIYRLGFFRLEGNGTHMFIVAQPGYRSLFFAT
jgi:hypothetical protein